MCSVATQRPRKPAQALGAALKEARLARGLTRAALAQKLEVDASSVYRWESGTREPCSDDLVALAHALGVSCSDLWAQVEQNAGR